MTPAVKALVEFAEGLTADQDIHLQSRMELAELVDAVKTEDPLAAAFEKARAGFRRREA